MGDIPGARPARHHPQPAPLRPALVPPRPRVPQIEDIKMANRGCESRVNRGLTEGEYRGHRGERGQETESRSRSTPKALCVGADLVRPKRSNWCVTSPALVPHVMIPSLRPFGLPPTTPPDSVAPASITSASPSTPASVTSGVSCRVSNRAGTEREKRHTGVPRS